MAVVSSRMIFERGDGAEVISGLSQRELVSPEGAGFDLTLRGLFTLNGGGMLGVEERCTSDATPLPASSAEGESEHVLLPGAYYLASTHEEVRMPLDLLGLIHGRTTLLRSGVALISGVVSPGYSGALTFGLAVLGENPFRITIGARFANITFLEVTGGAEPYRGQWQGGRIVGPEPEEQT